MSDLQLETWTEAIDGFPLTGSREAKYRAAIGYAVDEVIIG